MNWTQGYLLLCSICGALFFKDFFPLVPKAQLVLPGKSEWLAILAYIISFAVLGSILPGKVYDGNPLANGTRLRYKCNGLLVTGVVVTILVTLHLYGYVDGAWVANHYAKLFVATNILAICLSTLLLIKGRLYRPPNWLRSRSLLEDFIMGAELNPFLFGLDLKFFSYRPSMAGWLIINLSFICKQSNELGYVTGRMLLYQLATMWYIWDYFVHEPMMLSTWDIIAEHFGLMLVWGDYVFVVFAFSIQNFFLLYDTRPVSHIEIIGACALFFTGFAIFRGTNSQKHQFKTHPKALIWGRPPILVRGKLLASGFWGLARHMNYTGDLLMALSFCVPCGFRSSIPYLYFIYLLLLLLHRGKRDEERCSLKYKSIWDDYCMHVPYRMVPFVY